MLKHKIFRRERFFGCFGFALMKRFAVVDGEEEDEDEKFAFEESLGVFLFKTSVNEWMVNVDIINYLESLL